MARSIITIHEGSVFGKLTTVSGNAARIDCVCECGNKTTVNRSHLKSGNTKSCGCVKRNVLGDSRRKHGRANSRLTGYADRTYGIWQAMRARCYNKNNSHYASYGGRGITVCDEWNTSFEKFVEDMGNAPEGKSIDRIDVNKSYDVNNCVWSTAEEQGLSTQRSTVYEVDGVRKTVNGWAKTWGVFWTPANKTLLQMAEAGTAKKIKSDELAIERKAEKLKKYDI